MKKILLVFVFLPLISYCYSQVTATLEDGTKLEFKTSNGIWAWIVDTASAQAPEIATEPCNCLYEYMRDEIDEFTGKNIKSLTPTKIGASSSGIVLRASVGQVDSLFIVYLIYDGDLGLMSRGDSKAMFKFLDGSILTLYHIGDTHYGEPMAFGANASYDLNTFRTKGIEKIRLEGTKNSIVITLEKGEYFMEAFNCCIF